MMWDASKLIILLVIVSVGIVTIDQYTKKGRYWKTWLGASLLACLVFAVISMAGPRDFTPISISGEKSQDSAGPSGDASGGTDTKAQSSPQNSGENNNGQEKAGGQKTGQQPADQQNGGQTDPEQPTADQSGNSQATTGEANNSQSAARQTAGLSKDLLLPVDEASLDPDFQKFRESFLVAVGKKDLAFLKKRLSPDIRYSFGENHGVNGFLQEWQLNKNPDKSGVWSELARVLELGGSFDEKRAVFTAPYVFSRFPSNLDAFTYTAVIRDNVSVLSAPNPDSSIIMGLSFKILKLADSKSYNSTGSTLTGEASTWRKVETPSGAGFINTAYIRSPVDYRAMFRKEDGEWKMILFVAGD